MVEAGECCCFCISLHSQKLPSRVMHEYISYALCRRKCGVVFGPLQKDHLKRPGDLSTERLQVCHLGWGGSCRTLQLKLHLPGSGRQQEYLLQISAWPIGHRTTPSGKNCVIPLALCTWAQSNQQLLGEEVRREERAYRSFLPSPMQAPWLKWSRALRRGK